MPKGIFCLINAFRNILKKYPSCRLILVGSMINPDNILKSTKCISSKITFTGQISYSELEKLYQISDIGVIPSYTEQCTYTGIEMMMHGLAIVSSDGLGLQEMFLDNVNSRIAKVGNRKNTKEFEKNLTTSILELLSSESLCSNLKKNARKMYERKYSLIQGISDYSILLKKL